MVSPSSDDKLPWGTIFLFGIWVLIVILVLAFLKSGSTPVSQPQELMGVLRPEPKPLEQFELTDQNGIPFNRERLLGKWSFLFFGYTYCPDICPTTLAVLTTADAMLKKEAPEAAADSRVIFISVDPERDTLEKLSTYMAYYNQEFTAVTGTKTEIDNLAGQCGAGYIKEPESAPGFYLVSHTSAIFLTDPKARLVAAFSQPHIPKNIVSLYQKIRAFYAE